MNNGNPPNLNPSQGLVLVLGGSQTRAYAWFRISEFKGQPSELGWLQVVLY